MEREFDLVVLGGGPAGYPAAIRAAQLGANVCLVEKGPLGGTCLNEGCIPTKTLHGLAHLLEQAVSWRESGFGGNGIAADPAGLFAHKERVVSGLVQGVEKLLKARKIDVVRGTGRITGPGTVAVEGVGTVKGSSIIIATGSSEAELPGMAFDGGRILSSADILDLGTIPDSLIIVGGGVIGCEFASIFNAFGAKVAIVEMLPRLIATEDVQIGRYLQTFFRRKGIVLHLNARVERTEADGDSVRAILDNGAGIEAEYMLVSVGRRPNVDHIGLETLRIARDRTGIVVNERMETDVPGIYAAGDVVGGMLLAHVATREGITASENALGRSRTVKYDAVPSTIYTLPEISRVGLTEDGAKEKGIGYVTGRFPFAASGKAKGLREEDGFVKWIAGKQNARLLGLHIIGPQAAELVAPGILAVERGMSVDEFAASVFPHPTLSESLMEAVESIRGTSIHLAK